jgi:hypothetical protein
MRTMLRPDARGMTNFNTWTPGDVVPVGRDDRGVTNVGPRIPVSAMTVINGDHVPVAGQTYTGLFINGRIIPGTGSTGAIYRDCIATGRAWGQGPTYDGAPANDAIFNNNYNGRGVTLEWCALDGTGKENVWTDGVRGNNFTMRYCEIMRTNDGFGASSGGYHGPTLIENCRIHSGNYFGWWNSVAGTVYPNFPTSPSDRRSHNDGMQIQGWRGYTIRGCYIGGQRAPLGSNGSGVKQANRDYLIPAQAAVIAQVSAADDYNNACFMIQNNSGILAFTSALIEKNWVAGGDACFNFSAATAYGDDLSGVTVRDNRVIRQSSLPGSDGYEGAQIYRSTNSNPTLSGNVWDDTGLPVGILNNTETFTLGTTRPTPFNAGVTPGTVLTTVVGDITTTAAGQIIENKDVFGFINVLHANVIIRNCRVRGRDTGALYVIGGQTLPGTPSFVPGSGTYPSPSPAGDGAYARAFPANGQRCLINGDSGAATNLLVERCTLKPDFPSWWCMGVYARGATVTRCDISSVGDGVEVRGGACTITGNYIHDLILFDMDYDQKASSPPWWSHNDGVMVQGGSGTLIRGNYFVMKMTGARTGVMAAAGFADLQYGAGVTVAATQSAVNNLSVNQNWFKGGNACFQANQTNTAAGWTGASDVIGTITGNRVSHDQHEVPVASTYQIRYAVAGMVSDNTGNIWDGDPSVIAWNPAKPGTALTVGFTGGIRIG